MDIDVKRWQKLSGVLNENAGPVEKKLEGTCEAHGLMNCGECSEADHEVEDAVKESLEKLAAARELESKWSSGNVFGKNSVSRNGSVTLGIPGMGFKN